MRRRRKEREHSPAPKFFAPQVPNAPTEIPEALLGVPTAPDEHVLRAESARYGVPASEPRSLADELVARAERSRETALARTANHIYAHIYIGDAILALTERLTELDQ